MRGERGVGGEKEQKEREEEKRGEMSERVEGRGEGAEWVGEREMRWVGWLKAGSEGEREAGGQKKWGG